jgi:hypothetical protein
VVYTYVEIIEKTNITIQYNGLLPYINVRFCFIVDKPGLDKRDIRLSFTFKGTVQLDHNRLKSERFEKWIIS